jgi:hypothetical protein
VTSPPFDLSDIFQPDISDRCTDQIAAVSAILELAGTIGAKHGPEHGLWALMAALGIAARAVEITPRQCSASMAVVRKRVDLIVEKLGADGLDAESIVIEMHMAR